jgi:Ca-activated chloride channel family protein
MMHQLHFLRPLWLLALPALWALTGWLARRRAGPGDWSRIIEAPLLSGLRLDDGDGDPRHGGWLRRPWLWLGLAWTLAALALAGPSWQRVAAAAYRSPAAWVLVLDLSPSMAATDVTPDRATRAHYALDDLLAGARDARVALVAFSDESYTVTPLTDDVATVRALLPPLAPDIMPTPGDNLAPALDRAAALLKTPGTRNRHVIVLSDGFDDPAAAFSAAHNLSAAGTVVDVIGIGTAHGAPVPGPHGGFEANAQGQPRLARLDADRLRQLAAAGDGEYVDLDQLPQLIRTLQTPHQLEGGSEVDNVEVARWRDAGFWLLPGLLLLTALMSRRGWL